MQLGEAQLFFMLLTVWFVVCGFLGYVNYCRQIETARGRLFRAHAPPVSHEPPLARTLEAGRVPRPQASASPYPPLCHWRPSACAHLNQTRKAIDHWRQQQWLADRADRQWARKPSVCRHLAAPVRLSLRGEHFRSWWGHVTPTIVQSAEQNCSTPCRIRGIRPSDAHVVVDTFSPGHDRPGEMARSSYAGFPRKTAVLALEAGGNGPHTPTALAHTDMLLTWVRSGTDVPINYMYGWQDLCRHLRPDPLDIEACMASVPTREHLAEKRLAAAFVSNCGRKALERKMFMRALFRHLAEAERPVDSWGNCMRTPGLPRNERDAIGGDRTITTRARPALKAGADGRRGFRKIALLESRYKFAFAFENAIRIDYVTEKALQPLLASVIPVIWGAPNACDFLPGGRGKNGPVRTCINALDFATPRELANHLLELDRDDDRYLQYFSWRRDQGGSGNLQQQHSSDWHKLQSQSFTNLGDDSWPCRVCKTYRQRYCQSY